MSVKSIVLFCLFLFPSAGVVGQQDTILLRTYGGPQMESGNEILESDDGAYFIIGTTGSVDDVNTNFYLLKIDSLLNFQWSKVYGGADIDWGQSICPTDDGNLLLLGYTNSFGNGGYDLLLYKVNHEGELIWSKNYGGSDWDFGYKVRPHPNGGFVLLGETYSYGSGNNDVYIIKVDTEGVIEWEQTLGNENDDVPADFEIDDSGLIYVLYQGISNSGESHSQEIVILNDLGVVIDSDTKNDMDYNPRSIDFGAGHVFVSGSTITEDGISQLYSVRLDENFDEMWYYTSPTDGNDGFVDAVFYSNKLQITGFTENFGNGQRDVLAYRLHTNNGAWQWSATFGSEMNDYSNQIYMDSENSLLHVGTNKGQINASSDVFIVKYFNTAMTQDYSIDSDVYEDISLDVENIDEHISTHQVSPNPCQGYFDILGVDQKKIEGFELIDSSGRVVKKENYRVNSSNVDVNELQNGLYFVLYQIGDLNYSLPLIINK